MWYFPTNIYNVVTEIVLILILWTIFQLDVCLLVLKHRVDISNFLDVELFTYYRTEECYYHFMQIETLNYFYQDWVLLQILIQNG